VHHADPAVDVTTALRQHPLETLARYGALAAVAIPLGASPAAFAIYRLWSATTALVEHANVRLPAPVDTVLAWIVVSPGMHRLHHARDVAESNSNYGNVLSIFDRLFGTFTAPARGRPIAYGVDGYDDRATHTVAGLLALPFRRHRGGAA
jgi:sterol desaturase/sphingolipid hydroxylase (fatty acid hydroxylase superfamily)